MRSLDILPAFPKPPIIIIAEFSFTDFFGSITTSLTLAALFSIGTFIAEGKGKVDFSGFNIVLPVYKLPESAGTKLSVEEFTAFPVPDDIPTVDVAGKSEFLLSFAASFSAVFKLLLLLKYVNPKIVSVANTSEVVMKVRQKAVRSNPKILCSSSTPEVI